MAHDATQRWSVVVRRHGGIAVVDFNSCQSAIDGVSLCQRQACVWAACIHQPPSLTSRGLHANLLEGSMRTYDEARQVPNSAALHLPPFSLPPAAALVRVNMQLPQTVMAPWPLPTGTLCKQWPWKQQPVPAALPKLPCAPMMQTEKSQACTQLRAAMHRPPSPCHQEALTVG